jgi:hypothetical protein
MPQITSAHPARAAAMAAATMIRTLVLPAAAPAYDDERPASAPGRRPPTDHPVPPPLGVSPGPASRAIPGAPADQVPGQGPWPGQFAQILAETLSGSRPQAQLVPWTTVQAQERIRQLGPALASDQRPRVRRLMSSVPAPGVLEMTAVVGFGARIRVLGVRLERQRGGPGRWRCTAIDTA